MNNPLELHVQRTLMTQRVIDLLSGPITEMDQIQENLRELEYAVSKIEAKQPSKFGTVVLKVRRYRNRFLHSQKQA
jgi:hypothetical protein